MNRKIIFNIAIISVILMVFATSYTFSGKHHSSTIPPYTHDGTLNDPVLFAVGVITTKDDEFGGAFTPDGATCYFSKSVLRFYLDIICYSQFKNGKWQNPE